jgi:amidophosphoribosyltransferase
MEIWAYLSTFICDNVFNKVRGVVTVGGLFGVVSKEDCVMDVYFGTDYHSHLGTSRGGMAIWNGKSFDRSIHNIEHTHFRAKFEAEIPNIKGNMGIGCISDTDPQPLLVRSHLGRYAITMVVKINNLDEIIKNAFSKNIIHFMETSKGTINPTEVVSIIIDHEESFKNGLLKAQELIQGSCSILLLTPQGIYASRDKLGRTPLIVGKKEGSYCVSFESCTFANLEYNFEYELGPGEIILLTPDGIEKIAPPRDKLKICAFLWVYYGYSSSTYEGMNVEVMRYRNGAAFSKSLSTLSIAAFTD